MVLEVVILNVREGETSAYESAFSEAKSLIAGMPGFISLELQRCVETANRYLLLVEWERLDCPSISWTLHERRCV